MVSMPKPITNYRNWVVTRSRKGRLGLFLGVVVLFFVTGLNVDLMIATLPRLSVRFITLFILLFILYTVYALGRSVVVNVVGDR